MASSTARPVPPAQPARAAPGAGLDAAAPGAGLDAAAPVLVAGIGNLFLSDDGFGPEVVRRLAAQDDLPAHVKVVDYGIRGIHLAYDLLDGYRALVLVDALPGHGAAGHITLLEVGPDDLDPHDLDPGGLDPAGLEPPGSDHRDLAAAGTGQFALDPHAMAPVAVLASVRRLGGTLPPTYVVGCHPANLDEGIGLSDVVSAAVPRALAAVRALLSERLAV